MFDRQIPSSDDDRRALAFYREARIAQQNFLVSYAVPNYYKVIEIGYVGKEAAKWLEETFRAIIHGDTLAQFLKECGDEPPEKYIWKACRVAVAHANPTRSSDSDHAEEIRRLHTAADVMRLLARHFIKTNLGVTDSIYSGE